MEHFFCKTKIISGAGAVAALEDLHIRRLFLVCDPFFEKNGTAQNIIAAANAAESRIFSDVVPDPSVQLVARGAALVRDFSPDALISLGGGSAMDCAKAMAFFSGCKPTQIAIPTTSGSGSEVTDFAILTHAGVKHPLVDSSVRPDIAILDENLVSSMPAALVADGGFDLISHALEAYVAVHAGAFSDLYAVQALKIALSQLQASFGGDKPMRGNVHMAATMAGIAFSNAGLGLCHAISHSLGGAFHIPHGRLNAILLPSVMEVNAAVCRHRYGELSRSIGLSTGNDVMAFRALKAALLRLRHNLHLPETLAQAGVSPLQIQNSMDALVSATLADPCCDTNPLSPTPEVVKQIITEVCGRE